MLPFRGAQPSIKNRKEKRIQKDFPDQGWGRDDGSDQDGRERAKQADEDDWKTAFVQIKIATPKSGILR